MAASSPTPPTSPDERLRDEAEAQSEFLRRGRASLADTVKTGKRFGVDEVIDEMRARLQKKLGEVLRQRERPPEDSTVSIHSESLHTPRCPLA